MKNITLKSSFLSLLMLSLAACGGGSGGSDSGILIQGSLSQGGEAHHEQSLIAKHSSGEKIENVQICALGECSTTDAQGQWGFVAPEGFNGGEVQFTINGHGIDTASIIEIPAANDQVFVQLVHTNGVVTASHIGIDGRE